MYQAIEATAKAGTIQPLEPVQFDEDEHLVILRIPKTWGSQIATTAKPSGWGGLIGALKASPNLNGDPVQIQQDMRREWD